MGGQYSLDYLKNNSTLYKLAEKYDSAENKGNNDRILNGKEVSLFTAELKSRGINFDFSKIKDSDYLSGVDKQYAKELKQAEKRKELINALKDEYSIEQFKNSNGEMMYRITPKKDVNVSGVTSDLKLVAGTIAENNDGYGQWDGPNGGYIGNKQMKGVSFVIPERALGAQKGFFEAILDLW